jgi:hypothetical protein
MHFAFRRERFSAENYAVTALGASEDMRGDAQLPSHFDIFSWQMEA